MSTATLTSTVTPLFYYSLHSEEVPWFSTFALTATAGVAPIAMPSTIVTPTLIATTSGSLYLPLIKLPPLPGIWISSKEITYLPTSGSAWDNLFNAAKQDTSTPDLSDLDDLTDVYVLAKAFVYARTGESVYRDEVVASIIAAMGTEGDATSSVLPIARNLQGYVIAADLINLSTNSDDDLTFRNWLTDLRDFIFTGGPDNSIITCHESRPNNWGNHCGASRIAIARYLDDTADLDQAATIFKGYLGDRDSYAGFSYGNDLSWQCDPDNPVGINPVVCTKQGQSIDGAQPEEMRRGGPFQWPPPETQYAWEGLQGAVVQAQMLRRAGYPAWEWQDRALLRAVLFLYDVGWAAEGDDEWQIWLINQIYGTTFPTVTPVGPGKNMGWTDWTHSE